MNRFRNTNAAPAFLLCTLVFLAPIKLDTVAADEPPEGYSSTTMIKLAIAAGQLKLVDRDLPVPESVQVQEGIEYGRVGDVSLKLDLYSPKGIAKPVAGLIFIHGGGWNKGKRGDYRYYGVRLAERGYVVASISYRFSSVAVYPAAVEDAKCAVRWMKKNAAAIHVDPKRIVVAGGSAGGHLSMMVGYSSDVPALEGNGGHQDFSSRVRAVVNLYGPVDLTTPVARSHELVTGFIGATHDEAPDLYRQASPLTHVTSDDPPTLTFHGTLDDLVMVSQADALTNKLKNVGVETSYERLEGWPHAMDAAQVVNDYCLVRMLSFFDQHLTPSRTVAGDE